MRDVQTLTSEAVRARTDNWSDANFRNPTTRSQSLSRPSPRQTANAEQILDPFNSGYSLWCRRWKTLSRSRRKWIVTLAKVPHTFVRMTRSPWPILFTLSDPLHRKQTTDTPPVDGLCVCACEL